MPNLVMMLLAGVFNGVGDFFSKLAAVRMSPYLSAMLMSFSAIITVAIYLMFVRAQPGAMSFSKLGAFYAVLGGISIGAGMVFFFGLFSKGADIATAQPVIKSAVVLSAVLLGVIVLREKMSLMQVVGMVLSIAGIYFLTK